MFDKKTERFPFNPDWTMPPGVWIKEEMERCDISRAALAECLGLTHANVGKLLAGKIQLTVQIAEGLGRVTQIKERMWLSFERFYRQQLAKIKTKGRANV